MGNLCFQILNLYDYKFNKISDLVFRMDPWPLMEQIEERDEHFKIKIEVSYMYTELCYRHLKILEQKQQKESDMEQWEAAWSNYEMIFDDITNSKKFPFNISNS